MCYKIINFELTPKILVVFRLKNVREKDSLQEVLMTCRRQASQTRRPTYRTDSLDLATPNLQTMTITQSAEKSINNDDGITRISYCSKSNRDEWESTDDDNNSGKVWMPFAMAKT